MWNPFSRRLVTMSAQHQTNYPDPPGLCPYRGMPCHLCWRRTLDVHVQTEEHGQESPSFGDEMGKLPASTLDAIFF